MGALQVGAEVLTNKRIVHAYVRSCTRSSRLGHLLFFWLLSLLRGGVLSLLKIARMLMGTCGFVAGPPWLAGWLALHCNSAPCVPQPYCDDEGLYVAYPNALALSGWLLHPGGWLVVAFRPAPSAPRMLQLHQCVLWAPRERQIWLLSRRQRAPVISAAPPGQSENCKVV